MATRTPNYGLSKPLGTEDAQISVINANMDILDTELHLTTVRDAKNLAPIYDATSSYVEGDYVTYLITGQSSQDANGYFVFKCIDDTTTPAGNFDTTKWEAVCITDEMGSSGGSGGHTILDYDGTALQQEDNMQFAGTYSEDDSTNEKTVVHISRTMSKAQFNSLSEDEKKGIIATNDELPDDDTYFYPIIYSTEERQIGVWTDGKPLYQRTVITPSGIDIGVSSSSWTNTGIDVSSLNIEKIISSFGISTDGTYQGTILAYVENDNLTVQTTRNGNGWVVSFTIQYTKTTDVAGSGDWTPQGTPAVHYSTDEKVIGTWIDGNTIYEKTYDVSSSPIDLSPNTWVDTPFSATNITRIINFSALSSDGSNIGWLGVSRNGNYIRLQNVRNSNIPIAILTIQYTKSS